MSNEEFEKVLKEYELEHLTGSGGLVRKIAGHFYAARQPEIDALKAERDAHRDNAQQLVEENAALKEEVKRLKAVPVLAPAPVGFRYKNRDEQEDDWSWLPIRFLERNKSDNRVFELLYNALPPEDDYVEMLEEANAELKAEVRQLRDGIQTMGDALADGVKRALELVREWKKKPDKPKRGPDGSVKYLYGATLPTLVCTPMKVCSVRLQEGEIVNSVTAGDPDCMRMYEMRKIYDSGSSLFANSVPDNDGLRYASADIRDIVVGQAAVLQAELNKLK